MDVFLDKSWVKMNRNDLGYRKALGDLLDYACASSATEDNKIFCPCSVCANRYCFKRDVVWGHMIIKEMDGDYQNCIWVFHGERRISDDEEFVDDDPVSSPTSLHENETIGMVEDAFEFHEPNTSSPGTSSPGTNAEAQAFSKLLEDAGQPLYSGCEEFNKLSFIVEMYQLKCLYGVTDTAFDALLKLFKRALPKDSTLPNSFSIVQSTIKKLGLNYEKIDVCPNDCVLFRKENISLDRCPTCDTSRWKKDNNGMIMKLATGQRVPEKILRHFPLIPRLKRLFMSSKTAPLMRWHKEERISDGKMRHPADSPAWVNFDVRYKDFASDPRNVRLGLSSDGFNPFGMMSTQYSMWPVVLMPYNLPTSLFMNQPYLMLSLLIPGPKGPGNDIDVFLEPLIDELKILWDSGVETFDASRNESFTMHAALFGTINDFPAYGNLSGWTTKGYKACPCCNIDTTSKYLKKSRKLCYMGHRRWLEQGHRFRRSKKPFDGNAELRPQPISLSGTESLVQMKEVDVMFGKHPETVKRNKRKRDKELPWKKESCFYKLAYWKHLPVRHYLDVMHVEKNVSESILGTLFGIDGKSKDTLQSRLDLVDMNIRHELHPKKDHKGKTFLPAACFTLSEKEKDEMLSVLASVRVPDGYASNLKRRITDGKISGLKSHDHHILMQQLLPLALRKMKNKDVSSVLIEVCNFFKGLCSKSATLQDFENLQTRIVLTLCHLERIFPPSFFDIMVHVIIHLGDEAAEAGSVYSRWMYPIERFLKKLKMYVRNKSRPEGSIAEGFILEECLAFCSRYLNGVETRENRAARNDSGDDVYGGLPIFSPNYRVMSKATQLRADYTVIEQAHSYILANCDKVQVYVKEHYKILRTENQHMAEDIEKIHKKLFPSWFAANVSRYLPTLPTEALVADDLRYLSLSPSMWIKTMTKITCNGYRWRVKEIDMRSVTQNSGVLVKGMTGNVAYYGVLTEIIELSYPHQKSVILFRCDWVNPTRGVKQDEHGFTLVNLKSIWKTDEPFVLSSQATQVFYTPESKEKNWHVAIVTKPRNVYEMEEESIPEVDQLQPVFSNFTPEMNIDDSRQDVPGVTIDEPFDLMLQRHNDMDSDVYHTESDEEDNTLFDYDSDSE